MTPPWLRPVKPERAVPPFRPVAVAFTLREILLSALPITQQLASSATGSGQCHDLQRSSPVSV
jgi:hypothetical protein